MDGTWTEALAALVMVESCVSGVISIMPGLTPVTCLPEVLSVDVRVIKVFVTLEFHGKSLFDDGRPDSLIAWIPQIKRGPTGIMIVGIQNVAHLRMKPPCSLTVKYLEDRSMTCPVGGLLRAPAADRSVTTLPDVSGGTMS